MPTSQKPIVLVGPMGVGKTTIGKKLAKSLGAPFVDSDHEIAAKHGAIPKIFETLGEKKFREFEEDVVLGQLGSYVVLATGGGAVLSARVREALAVAFVVYLETDGRHMPARLAAGNRPLLRNGMGDWRAIYESRRALYEEVADLTIDTSKNGLKDNVKQILAGLEQHVES